jgi:outer membrane biogenesis lipoprotein LolB
MKPRSNKLEVPKPDVEDKSKDFQKLKTDELDIINYDQDGKVAINSKKKNALIDFFE